jgi:hypothetical protein
VWLMGTNTPLGAICHPQPSSVSRSRVTRVVSGVQMHGDLVGQMGPKASQGLQGGP